MASRPNIGGKRRTFDGEYSRGEDKMQTMTLQFCNRFSLAEARRQRSTCSIPCGRKVACTSKCCLPDSPGFDTEFVVDCYSQTLPAANIAFGGLNRDMPEKKLNLLELASRIVAEPRA